jgi:lipid-A-disaccharide synthase-like uncharacterized protein
MASELVIAVAETGAYWSGMWQKLRDPIVVVGLAGQVIFGGRMVVQWWVSERRGRSLVPKVFWHMSLWGSVLVLIYGFLDRDPVVICGQALGFVIYVRNLVLMSRGGQIESPTVSKFDSSTISQDASRQGLRATDGGLADPLDSPLGPR